MTTNSKSISCSRVLARLTARSVWRWILIADAINHDDIMGACESVLRGHESAASNLCFLVQTMAEAMAAPGQREVVYDLTDEEIDAALPRLVSEDQVNEWYDRRYAPAEPRRAGAFQ